ncbi:MinD/ParA family ATP-binding protein [Halocatena halophila]|uniref:MinD/ParA family ATP-binding protein n=1 Tax=Halocatena halophila TaxID=2814576 RepID=UPI002ED1DEF9
MSGRVYAIAGGKGGVGKTTTVANLATALSAAGYDVVAVDVDLGMANLGPVLDIQPDDGATIHNVLAGDAGIKEATYTTDRGFAVIPGTQALDEYASADPSRLQYATGPLTDEYEIILLDLSAGLSEEVIAPLQLADSVVLVTTPDVVAIRDAAKTGELTARVGGVVEGVAVNRARDDPQTEELIDELGDEVLTAIPNDERITMSNIVAQPVSEAARSFSDLAATLLGEEALEEIDGQYATQQSVTEAAESEATPTETESESETDEQSGSTSTPEQPPAEEPPSATADGSGDTAESSTPEPVSTASQADESSQESPSATESDEPIPDSGPVATAAFDERRSDGEAFFSDERREEKRASALGRLRKLFD